MTCDCVGHGITASWLIQTEIFDFFFFVTFMHFKFKLNGERKNK